MSRDSTCASLKLSSPVSDLPGVGRSRTLRLRRLGIESISDLIRHRPLRYEYEQSESGIRELVVDTLGSARGTVARCRWVGRSGPRKGRFEATLQDATGTLALVWFNAAFLRQEIHPGMVLRVHGKVGRFGDYLQMINPRWERLGEEKSQPPAEKAARYRPVYPSTEDMPSRTIEQLIEQALPQVLPQITDPLPEALVRAAAMPGLAEAFTWLHCPEHEDQALAARRRLAFNELLLLQLGIELKRHHNQTALVAWPLRWSQAIDQHIRDRFPFELTPGQEDAIAAIREDLKRDRPMNRLVQGDVGAGKTVVALYALLMAVADRKQGALMAPTELLAEQHYASVSSMLAGSNVRLALITAGRGTATGPRRREIVRRVEAGEVDIVIGTQALISSELKFNALGVVVIDEQHRFGVLQRAAFKQRADENEQGKPHSPHYLVMTATPIPRTLSLTVFGDLDVSVIRGLPPGRTPIESRVVPPEKSADVYDFVLKRVSRGEQAYVVAPTIEQGEESGELQLKNVTAHKKLLAERFGAAARVEAVHGRLKREEREGIMDRFRRGEIDVLVATTVIEVGVDVPNATVMVIEHAERFGLAQLHQLRGRIGRGDHVRASVCVFITDPVTDEAKSRMRAIAETRDGFVIAEKDLEIRGMGDFFGTRQHGLPPLRVASLPRDMELLQLAQRHARQIVEADPALADPQLSLLRKLLIREYGDALSLIDVG